MEHKKKIEEKNYLITTSNDLANARYSLGIVESRLFMLALSKISPTDDELKTYRIYIADFLKLVGISTSCYYGDEVNDMKAITKRMLSKVIEITKKNGRPTQFNLFSIADYDKDEKGVYVEIGFNTYIKPDLIRLKEKFLSYDLRNIISCKSNYTIRLYPLLKQYLYKGERIEKVETLKYLLEVEKEYIRYNDFKRFVIHKVQKELREKTDLCFEFEELKSGRTISHIKFIIKLIKLDSEQEKILQTQNPLMKKLTDLGFNEKQATEVVKRETPDFIIDNAVILENYLKEGKIKSNVPAFSVGFTKDFRMQKTVHESELEIKKEQAKLDAEIAKKIKSDEAKAQELGQKVYYEAFKIYMTNFFINRELNGDLIKDFETKYIKTGTGALLYKNRPDNAKQAFLMTKIEKTKLDAEVLKLAEANGYLLTEEQGKWYATEDI